ncbi:hypothetical protein CC2G_004090 [Coprinopsis cinerea AmutBmut pab1-1]|nr:hypothetical protein CC2G_004090 [Coprinopsis cinerea AmutBmut pab1-1]
MRSQPPSRVPHLDDDVWLLILSSLYEDGFGSALRRVALTCHRLRPLAHQFTFRVLVFKTSLNSLGTPYDMDDRIRTFKKIAIARRQILDKWVRGAVFSVGLHCQQWLQTMEFALLLATLNQRACITSLLLESTHSVPIDARRLPACFWDFLCPNLRELTLVNVTGLDFTRVFPVCGSLLRVRLQAVDAARPRLNSGLPRPSPVCFDYSTQWNPLHPARPQLCPGVPILEYIDFNSLENASFTSDTGADIDVLVSVVNRARTSLRSLRVNVEGWIDPGGSTDMIGAVPFTLTSLHLWSVFGKRGCHPIWTLEPMADALVMFRCSTLKHVILEIRYSSLSHFAAILSEHAPWDKIDDALATLSDSSLCVTLCVRRTCIFDPVEWNRGVLDVLVDNPRFNDITGFVARGLSPEHVCHLLPRSVLNNKISFHVVPNI